MAQVQRNSIIIRCSPHSVRSWLDSASSSSGVISSERNSSQKKFRTAVDQKQEKTRKRRLSFTDDDEFTSSLHPQQSIKVFNF